MVSFNPRDSLNYHTSRTQMILCSGCVLHPVDLLQSTVLLSPAEMTPHYQRILCNLQPHCMHLQSAGAACKYVVLLVSGFLSGLINMCT